jgi:hypothetical protein
MGVSGQGGTGVLYSGTANGLMEFLDYAKAKGILAQRTANAYKSACSLLLAIDGEGWQEIDVRALDVDRQMDRYVRLRGGSAKPETLSTYRQRVLAAIGLYQSYLVSPTAFRGPAAKPRSSMGRRKTEGVTTNERRPEPEEPTATPGPSRIVDSTLLTYPFPLRSGQMAYLQLPRNVPPSDVRRLCAFLESLAIESSDDSTAGGAA